MRNCIHCKALRRCCKHCHRCTPCHGRTEAWRETDGGRIPATQAKTTYSSFDVRSNACIREGHYVETTFETEGGDLGYTSCVCGRDTGEGNPRCKNCSLCLTCHSVVPANAKYKGSDGIMKLCACRKPHCVVNGIYTHTKFEKEGTLPSTKSETKKIIGAVVFLGGKGKRIVALDDNNKVTSSSDFFPEATEVQWVYEGEDPASKVGTLFNAIKGVAGQKYEFGFLKLDSAQIAELPVKLTPVEQEIPVAPPSPLPVV